MTTGSGIMYSSGTDLRVRSWHLDSLEEIGSIEVSGVDKLVGESRVDGTGNSHVTESKYCSYSPECCGNLHIVIITYVSFIIVVN